MNNFILKISISSLIFLTLLYVVSVFDYDSATNLVKEAYGVDLKSTESSNFSPYIVSIGETLTIKITNTSLKTIYSVDYDPPTQSIIAGPALSNSAPRVSANGDTITYEINDGGCKTNKQRVPIPDNTTFPTRIKIVTSKNIQDCIESTAKKEAAKNQSPKVQKMPPLTMNENTKTPLLAKVEDPNPEDKVKLLWEQVPGGPILKLEPNNQKQTTLIAPEILPPNQLVTIKLTADDNVNEPVDEQFQVTIKNVNKPPIIDISKVGPVSENKSVVLDAIGTSDPDKDQPLRFSWKQITKTPKAVIENNQTSRATFIAPNVQKDTNIQLQLTVSDGNKLKGTANRTLIIPVKQVNLPPVADAGKNFVANESSIVTLNGNKTKDPDKLDKLKYLWTQVAGELFIDIKNGKTVKPSFKVPFVKQNNSLYTFKLTVTDPKGLNSSDTVNMTVRKISNITVNPPNAQVVQNLTVQEGKNATLSAAKSTDPDVKEKLTFQWKQIGGQPQVDLRDANKATAKFIAPVVDQNTTLTFNVTATNKKGLNDTATTSVKIANIPEQGFQIIYAIIGGVGAAGAAAAFVIYKFFMGRPSGPGRAT